MSSFWDHEVVHPHHVEWMPLPAIRSYINRSIGGDEPRWPIDWFQSWLGGRRFDRALSIGCGAGALERDLIGHDLCRSVDAFDASERALIAAGMPPFYAVIVARPRRSRFWSKMLYLALRLRRRFRART